MTWTVYLAGEIHTDWRQSVASGSENAGLSLRWTGPVTDHSASDDCGAVILGPERDPFWHDHKSAKINAIRTRRELREADVVVAWFGTNYRQWNTAFDAGFAAALGKPLIVVHPEEHRHALKEIDAAALAVCRDAEQVVDVLRYAITGELEGRL